MRYFGMPMGMWVLFGKSFHDHLMSVLGYSQKEADRITAAAKPKYREIIASIPEFEKTDRFRMNIVNCAMFSAFLLSMKRKPDLERLTEYYGRSMMTSPMKLFFFFCGRRKFSRKDVLGMEETAKMKAAERNPYSWNMDFLPYPDGSGYEARFKKCGICALMKELGLFEMVPAMCRLDYTMTEAGGTAVFVRKYTLASGGPYCDCGYKKKER